MFEVGALRRATMLRMEVAATLRGMSMSCYGRCILNHYPSLDSMPTMHQLVSDYAGERLLAMSCDHAGAPNCFDFWYQHREHPTSGKRIHQLSLRPGGYQRSTKRDDEPDLAQGEADANDGTPVFCKCKGSSVSGLDICVTLITSL